MQQRLPVLIGWFWRTFLLHRYLKASTVPTEKEQANFSLYQCFLTLEVASNFEISTLSPAQTGLRREHRVIFGFSLHLSVDRSKIMQYPSPVQALVLWCLKYKAAMYYRPVTLSLIWSTKRAAEFRTHTRDIQTSASFSTASRQPPTTAAMGMLLILAFVCK